MSEDKAKFFGECLATGASVRIFLETKAATLPKYLYSSRAIALDYGLNLPIPIPDLFVDQAGIHGTLSFGGDYFSVFVPWDSIFQIHCGAMLGSWPVDAPTQPRMKKSSHLRLLN